MGEYLLCAHEIYVSGCLLAVAVKSVRGFAIVVGLMVVDVGVSSNNHEYQAEPTKGYEADDNQNSQSRTAKPTEKEQSFAFVFIASR